VLALSFVVLFNCARLVLHARAIATLNSRMYNGEVPLRVAAFPTPLNPLTWQALAETSDRYYLSVLNLNADFHPGSGRLLYKNDPGAAVPVLRGSKDFGSLIGFTQYALWKVTANGNDTSYQLTDLRFGDPVRQTFSCSARLAARVPISGPPRDERCDFTFQANFGEP
jgi:hypothetical protein